MKRFFANISLNFLYSTIHFWARKCSYTTLWLYRKVQLLHEHLFI